MKKEISYHYLNWIFGLDGLDDAKRTSAILASGQFEASEALTKEVLQAMDEEIIKEKAKVAAKGFYAKALSMKALETSMKKVDKDGDGIITRD